MLKQRKILMSTLWKLWKIRREFHMLKKEEKLCGYGKLKAENIQINGEKKPVFYNVYFLTLPALCISESCIDKN